MRSTRSEPNERGEGAALHWWAKYTPLVVLGYFAVQLLVRLWLSSNLELDDAEMVGQIHWAWGYANSHPPLYHWIVRLCHDAFGYWPAATAVPKFALLAIGYLLVYDAGRRATDCRAAGALAAASLLFIPVIAWKTQGKLTHSIVGFAATAATMHAVIVVLKRPRAVSFAWLGVAIAAGILAKYNYLLVLPALVLALVWEPHARATFRKPAALLAGVVALGLITPHLLWIRDNPVLATQRVYMLQTGGKALGFALPADSVADGLLSLALFIAASVLPALAVWRLALWRRRRADVNTGESTPSEAVRRVLGIVLLGEAIALVAVVLIGRFTQVHERYLVVLLPPFVLWLALRFPEAVRSRAAVFIAGTAAAVAVFVTIARPFSVFRGTGRLMFPYAEIAAEIDQPNDAPVAILGDRPDNAANVALRLSNASIFDPRSPAARVLVVADTPELAIEVGHRLGSSYVPDGELRVITRPLLTGSGRTAQLAVQPWRRRTDTARRTEVLISAASSPTDQRRRLRPLIVSPRCSHGSC